MHTLHQHVQQAYVHLFHHCAILADVFIFNIQNDVRAGDGCDKLLCKEDEKLQQE